MSGRLARLTPDALSTEQRELYDEIAGGPRAQGPQLFRLTDEQGALEGPFNAFLVQPRLGSVLQAVGSAVRYRTDLADRAREVAILVVAAWWDSSFERYAHEAVGRGAGLTDAEMAGIRVGDHSALPPADRLVADLTRRLCEHGDLDDSAYAAAVESLGEPGLFELLTLVGYYATLALQLRVFRVAAPTD